MPEYLSPGVYVTEVALNVRPIEGVSTSTASFVGADVVGKLQRLVEELPTAGKGPRGNNSDIALLELMAWMSDMLAHRVNRLGEEAYLPAARLAASILELLKDHKQPPNSALKCVRFFPGQLLVDDDLNAAVSYTRDKFQPKMPSGIVCGLQINVQDRDGRSTLDVTPGYALDSKGHKIVLDKPIALPLPATLKCASMIAGPTGGGPLSIAMWPTVKCEFLLVDEPKDNDFTVGRLENSSQGWRVL